jgi:hypothetical protein
MMKVHVVFEFPDVTDIDSQDADNEIAILNDALNVMYKHEGIAGYIDEVTE